MRIDREVIRIAFKAFGKNEQEISNAQIYEVLEAKDEADQAKIRTRINEMVRAGEIIKIASGLYTYNYKYKIRGTVAAAGYVKIWRFIRQAKDGWTIKECSLMTGKDNSHVGRYVNWLESEGFVKVIGKKEQAKCFCAAQKAKNSPETPMPTYKDSDPFEQERAAGAKIVRLLLCDNLYSPLTAQKITEACAVLQNRFNKQLVTGCDEPRTHRMAAEPFALAKNEPYANGEQR